LPRLGVNGAVATYDVVSCVTHTSDIYIAWEVSLRLQPRTCCQRGFFLIRKCSQYTSRGDLEPRHAFRYGWWPLPPACAPPHTMTERRGTASTTFRGPSTCDLQLRRSVATHAKHVYVPTGSVRLTRRIPSPTYLRSGDISKSTGRVSSGPTEHCNHPIIRHLLPSSRIHRVLPATCSCLTPVHPPNPPTPRQSASPTLASMRPY
jgi:hypothetical protein